MSNFEESTKSDTWTLVDIFVSENDSDLVTDFLWAHGVVAIEERPNDQDDSIILRTSFGDAPQVVIAELHQRFPHTTTDIVTVHQSVSETWRQFAEPTWINDSFVVVPQWVKPPESVQYILIEPLDTFGLGNHPTTIAALRLCLRYIPTNANVFDLGTGSGVLAVAIAKTLACTVMGFDISTSSEQALAMNAILNDVHGVAWSDGYPASHVDAVVANILAPVLRDESTNITTAVRDGGVVILSGMRSEQVKDVVQCFPTMNTIDTETIDGWTAVVLQK